MQTRAITFNPEVIDPIELVNRINNKIMEKSFQAFEDWQIAKSNAYLDSARAIDETLKDMEEEARIKLLRGDKCQ